MLTQPVSTKGLVSTVAGTFAGLAMALNGLATAFLAPLLFRLLH